MKVKNRRCIRSLTMKQLKATKGRNLIAIFAIALTTLLFTALFTVVLSIVSSYEEYTFRQVGGFSHGTFKEVSAEQIAALSAHKEVKQYGLRTVCGFTADAPFAKTRAEISWMDVSTAKWSYATPTTGRMPEGGMEIAMDTSVLEKLGVAPELGARIELTYREGNGLSSDPVRTDVFTLVGFWEYDDLMPVHYINVSEEYVKQVEADYLALGGDALRTDMNVMLSSSVNIRGRMEQIDTDLGYQWEDQSAAGCVRIGVNWGYTASEVGSKIDLGMIVSMTAFLLLVIFTGYLIIYNIFQISVGNDIRHYGLLKTIGTTPRQIRRMVRLQALYLSAVGIPLGCLSGYGVGVTVVPAVLSATTISLSEKHSASPFIFIGSAVFALLTVLISCSRPARNAGKITPIDALRYTDAAISKRRRTTRGAKIGQMAFANWWRNKTKTVLVVISLSLAVVLLDCAVMFVRGFSMEKYISWFSAADFLIGTTDYFQNRGGMGDAGLTEEQLQNIAENTVRASGGCVYATEGYAPLCWLDEETYRDVSFLNGELLEQTMKSAEHRDGKIGGHLMAEGFDAPLLDKLVIYEGDLSPLTDPSVHAIAVAASDETDEGEPYSPFRLGDTFSVTFVDEARYYDSRTGKIADDTTPGEFMSYRIEKSHDVEYTVCALVGLPYSMGFRYYINGGVYVVLDSASLLQDCNEKAHPMLYVFDTPDLETEAAAERFLSEYTEDSELQYESKALLRSNFENFKSMFSLVGGVLCFIVGLVGILNFLNAILTGILTRRREFAMLQSVGMTGKQLKQMLICEGIFYALAACGLSVLLVLVINPIAAKALGTVFWFFSYRFTIWPVLIIAPIFAALGVTLPLIVYHFTIKKSIVERLRATE